MRIFANNHKCNHIWTVWSMPYSYGHHFRQARKCTICKIAESIEVSGINGAAVNAICRIEDNK